MMRLSICAAMGLGRVIGVDEKLPWRLPKEMRRFRQVTMGKPVLMGRRTFSSLKKPLSGRYNIILSKSLSFTPPEGCGLARSLDEAISLAEAEGAKEAVVIGGEALFQEALLRAERLYLSVIEGRFSGDTYFPAVTGRFRLVEQGFFPADEDNPYAFHTLVLDRMAPDSSEGEAFDVEGFLERLRQKSSA